jgi:hypothetical protein
MTVTFLVSIMSMICIPKRKNDPFSVSLTGSVLNCKSLVRMFDFVCISAVFNTQTSQQTQLTCLFKEDLWSSERASVHLWTLRRQSVSITPIWHGQPKSLQSTGVLTNNWCTAVALLQQVIPEGAWLVQWGPGAGSYLLKE